MYRQEKAFLLKLAYWASLLLLAWLIFRYLLLWLLPFLIALALSTLLEPLMEFCRRHLHLRRSFLAAVFTLILLGVLIALSALLLTQLLQQSYEFLTQLPQYLSQLPALAEAIQRRMAGFCRTCPAALRSWMERFLSGFSTQLIQYATSLSGVCLKWLTSAVAALPQIILFCATTALAVFFTVGSFPSIMAFFRRQLRPEGLETARGVKKNLLSTLGKWLKAQCILLSITFIELLIGFLLLHQPYALLLAVLVALIDALPVFGTGTILVPWAIFCLIAGNIPRGIALLALYAVITLVRSITEPKVMAAQVDLPPLVALLAMYMGFCTLGVPGMIFFPVVLLFIKQLHDSGYIHLWKT